MGIFCQAVDFWYLINIWTVDVWYQKSTFDQAQSLVIGLISSYSSVL